MIRVVGAWLAFPFLAALILHLARKGWISPRSALIEQRDSALQAVLKKDLALYLCEQEVKRRQARIDDLCRQVRGLERKVARFELAEDAERWLSSQFGDDK